MTKQRQLCTKQRRDEDGRILIDGIEDIPTFATDADEIEFWRTHTPSDKFLERGRPMSLEEILAIKNLPQR